MLEKKESGKLFKQKKKFSNLYKDGSRIAINATAKALIYGMGRSTTWEEYESFYYSLHNLNLEAATWFHENRREFVAFFFLMLDSPRFGDLLNNASEQTNSAIVDARNFYFFF